MASSLSRSGASAGPTLPQHLAAICSSFDEDWKEGRRPRIEEVLERTRPFDRTTLLPHLIRIEVRHRVRLGETPRPDEYVARFPSNRDTIVEIDWQSLTPRGPTAEAANGGESVASTILSAPARRGAIGRYELIDRLGAGGFGEVWRAFDSHLQREVAVKIGHFDAADRSQAALLLHEARSAGRLRHPRIVPIHEAGTEGDVAYIVSDYIPGTNLATKLKSGPVPAKEAAGIALKLAEALAHAHDRGIVHRDVKPANVLIDPAGEPHLTDFGVARRAAGDKTISQAGQALGTPAYMSPEQARGDTAAIDLRTDVYALGLVLYEMLAGRRAYPGDAQVAFLAVLQGPPQKLRSVRGDVPRDLEAIIEVATARERPDRYATAAALAADLDRFLRGMPILGKRPGALERGWRWIRRRGVAVTVACMALAGVFAAARSRPTGGESTDDGSTIKNSAPSAVASADPTGPARGTGTEPPELLATGSNERRLVEIRTDPPGADVWLFPLEPTTGMVQADKLNDPSAPSPVRLELSVGFYHIVADLGGGRFSEAVRRVPPTRESVEVDGDPKPLAGIPSVNWSPIDGGIALTIPINEAPPLEEFTYFAGGVVSGRGPDGGPVDVSVPPFYLARAEMTLGEYVECRRRGWGLKGREKADEWFLPTYLRGYRLGYDHAIPLLFGDAESAACEWGARLPDEFEWGLAARSASSAVWDTLEDELPAEGFGPVGMPPSDRAGPESSVVGLRSNVAEWTSSWFTPVPGRAYPFDLSPRVVRGGDIQTLRGNPAVGPASRDADLRTPGEVQVPHLYRGAGCRLARSIKPRKVPQDFPQLLIAGNES